MKLEYLDLYLIHWPYAFKKDKNDPDNVFPKTANGGVSYEVDTPLTETWKEMQKLVEKGYCKHIGISNFNKRQIDTIFEMKELTVKPAALQIECHPYLNQEKLIAHARSKGMVITSYSPLVCLFLNYVTLLKRQTGSGWSRLAGWVCVFFHI